MSSSLCFIASQVPAAVHFYEFASFLRDYKPTELILAGSASLALGGLNPDIVAHFSDDFADSLLGTVQKCKNASHVIIDLGTDESTQIYEELRRVYPEKEIIVYYDRYEDHYTGYRSCAYKVLKEARVWFANTHFLHQEVYDLDKTEIQFTPGQRVGIGFYPMYEVERLRSARATSRSRVRQRFFSRHGLKRRWHKVISYMGGATESYFKRVFPRVLENLEKVIEKRNLSAFVFVLQKHPATKFDPRDLVSLRKWKDRNKENPFRPKFVISESSSEELEVASDAIWFDKPGRSMDWALAGIRVAQVRHKTILHHLVTRGISPSLITAKGMSAWFQAFPIRKAFVSVTEVEDAIGYSPHWQNNLLRALGLQKRYSETESKGERVSP